MKFKLTVTFKKNEKYTKNIWLGILFVDLASHLKNLKEI